jgi:Zn-dependent protease
VIAEPQPTRYDLNFRIGPFPARVHPFFWLMTLLMGQNTLNGPNPLAHLAIWVGVVFVSILVHELGHALAYRAFRSPARIWLYWFGGLAISNYPPGSPAKRIAVSLAGPGAGFVLAGLLYGSETLFGWRGENPYLRDLYHQAMWVNIGWGLVNLLPVLPLDGGQVCREACRLGGARQPDSTALKVSVAVAILAAVYGLMDYLGQPAELMDRIPRDFRMRSLYLPILFGILAFSSYQALQQIRRPAAIWDDPDDDTPPWRRR